MGSQNVSILKSKKDKSEYFHRLIKDIKALEDMLQQDLIEKAPIRMGAEQEFFIVTNEFLPNNNALELLKAIDDEHFTTEIGNFNLEINLDPIELRGNCFSQMHQQLTAMLDKAKSAAAKHDSKIILTGILPTLSQRHITVENMTPMQRYYVLNEVAKELRAQDFNIHIRGVDELTILHDSVMLEGCNTSFQMHLQVDPDEFTESYNWAQAIAGPILGICSNSPLLFGKELWSETRIALFTQSVDIRSNSYLLNEAQPRVSFDNEWQRGAVIDIFKDNVARFKSLVTSEMLEDSTEILKGGAIPKLRALNLHNGTVYRWNRACYGVGGGKPHLRIENRYIPAGPTQMDQIANMAFWIGVMKGRPEQYDRVHEKLDFKDAKSNFYHASRYGMGAQFKWDGKEISSQKLILEVFLPMAYGGLRKAGVSESDITTYLSIIEKRVHSHSGSEWIIKSYRNLLTSKKRNESLQVLAANLFLNQEKDIPVADWEILKSSATTTFNIEKKVHHVMSTDIFSVEEKDSLELVLYIMKWKNIHHMPVIRGDKELVGILSWKDLVPYFDSDEIKSIAVKKLMKTDLITISQDKNVDEAKELMKYHGFNSLPVVKDKKLVGIITSKDI
ncbi:CBS domain-containing protein [Aquiflexum lacus]|uniref:CBS domain-containing protein n=1 Tax=Aquiflexum lacus TaxID=2483805 RepID=UPI0018961D7D|nr:CBS domain-containing protein [Aquiflexum lacus]